MSLAFPTPDHMPCPDCGASLPVGDVEHVCDEDRRLDYLLVDLRPGLERFAADLAAWLETPQGRFARFLADRDR